LRGKGGRRQGIRRLFHPTTTRVRQRTGAVTCR
jgi:hypothetical protein